MPDGLARRFLYAFNGSTDIADYPSLPLPSSAQKKHGNPQQFTYVWTESIADSNALGRNSFHFVSFYNVVIATDLWGAL